MFHCGFETHKISASTLCWEKTRRFWCFLPNFAAVCKALFPFWSTNLVSGLFINCWTSLVSPGFCCCQKAQRKQVKLAHDCRIFSLGTSRSFLIFHFVSFESFSSMINEKSNWVSSSHTYLFWSLQTVDSTVHWPFWCLLCEYEMTTRKKHH